MGHCSWRTHAPELSGASADLTTLDGLSGHVLTPHPPKRRTEFASVIAVGSQGHGGELVPRDMFFPQDIKARVEEEAITPTKLKAGF